MTLPDEIFTAFSKLYNTRIAYEPCSLRLSTNIGILFDKDLRALSRIDDAIPIFSLAHLMDRLHSYAMKETNLPDR